ncbi:MAG: starch-binding protein [Ruminococcus sp.]|nr:starch-binding protein [Ruminococcus sp.]
MNNRTKRLCSLVLILILLLSVPVPLCANVKAAPLYDYERDGSFIKYKDGDYYRYLGPTGELKEDGFTSQSTVGSAEEYYKAHNIKSKDIATLGSSTLPSSVDLSKNKYFPPVGNQGGLGSCATFSAVYYQFSYAVNENRDVQATYENTRSPQIVYNFISVGSNDGTTHMQNYRFLTQFGAPTMAEVPYSDSDQFNWHTYDGIWREGIRARLKDYVEYDNIGIDDKQITSSDDPDLITFKTALNDGKVLGYSTHIYSWKATTLKTNPNAPENNKYAGEEVVTVCDGTSGGHAMAIVGYNDDIWTDINENNQVDNGEMGAFKIVNSWGDSYANNGFAWVAYDALNQISSVEGAPNTYRTPIFEYVRSITVRDYNELSDMYIQYTINTAKRTQHAVYLTGEKDGTIHKYKMFYDSGGGYTSEQNEGAFDGTNTACDGTFVCPLDNIASDFKYEDLESYNWSIEFEDTNADSNPLVIKDVRLVDEVNGNTYKVNNNLPFSVDGNSVSYDIKGTTKHNKAIYYVGFDNPTLHYKTNDGHFKSVLMEENLERIGSTHKYVIENTPDDVTLYFTDENGNVDDNSGKHYIADERLNYYRTYGIRKAAIITDINVPEDSKDTGIRFFFDTTVEGGYEPFNYQYLIENLDTGESKLIDYDYKYEKSHVFYKAGKYKVTVEVTDQAGDVSSFSKVMDIVNLPFEFESMVSNTKTHFVGNTSSFTAKTINEQVISRGPQKSLYKFDVKDNSGQLVYTKTNKCTSMHLGYKKSVIDFDYIPAKSGKYTLTVSSTDGGNEFAETTIPFTVFDKIFGDTDGNGDVNIMDATTIQQYLANIISDEQIYSDMADCDDNSDVNIMDATRIQLYLAKKENSGSVGNIIEYIPPTEPETEAPTPAPTQKPTEAPKSSKVTFTNSLNWSGTIYCYYWSDENTTMTSWPGQSMTNAGTNEFSQTLYTFDVPQGANNLIFTNGSSQTVDIKYSGGEVRYYALNTKTGNGYNVETW